MADRSPNRGGDVTGLHRVHLKRHHPEGGTGGGMMGGASPTKVLAVLAMIPAGGSLLALAGITLIGTLIGLAVATPLFILFSPVLVPAAIVLGLVVTGFITSGAFGLTALASISRIISYMRQGQGSRGSGPEGIEWAKRQAQDTADYVGQKTKEVGQHIQGKAREGART